MTAKNFWKNNYIILAIIALLGLGLRLWSLDKPLGLWNDEYIAWWISSFDFGKEFFEKISLNCHMPLYYFFLKIWCLFFGDSDYVLRLSSVFIGLLNIISLYFLGKEYQDTKTGLICALFGTASGFLIYFSQEVRLYGLIFLISTWIAYFFIKTLKKPTAKSFLLYLLCNFLLLLTHTISFVYVFFNMLIFSLILLKNPRFKRAVQASYVTLAVCFLPFVPFLITILTRDNLSQNWGVFNISKLFFVFIDYLTPVQTNISNSPLNLLNFFKDNNLFVILFFVIVPFVIATSFIGKALRQNEPKLRALTISALLYFVVLMIAAASGKLVLSTKYSIEIYPALILLFVSGIQLCGKLGKKFMILYFVSIFSYLLFFPNAPQKMTREEGHKAPIVLLTQMGITKADYVISLYHQFFRYEKYANFNPKHVIELDKGSVATYLMGEGYGEQNIKHNGKEMLKKEFLSQGSGAITQRIDSIYKSIPRGRKIAIIVPVQVAFFSSNDLKRIASNEDAYQKTEIMFMAFSYAKIKLINEAIKYCTLNDINELGSWIVLSFTKK